MKRSVKICQPAAMAATAAPAKKIPDIARNVGRAQGEFKKGMREGAVEESASPPVQTPPAVAEPPKPAEQPPAP